MDQNHYIETLQYRCLDEHFPHQTEDIYLIMCGIEQCLPDKKKEDRMRDGFHMHVILSGCGVLESGGTKTRLHEGQIFLIKPGERIPYYPDKDNPWAYCWMSWGGANAYSYAQAAGFTEGVYHLNANIETTKFFELCDKTLRRPQLNQAQALKRLGFLLEFMGTAIDSAEKGKKKDSQKEYPLAYQKTDYVLHAKEYIENNYSSINVSDVSRYLGIDRSYFSSIFRQSVGISPNEYLLQVRMQESSTILRSVGMSIQDVAKYVGYEDPLTFSKAFKRFFGVSPKYYREMPDSERITMKEAIQQRRKNEDLE